MFDFDVSKVGLTDFSPYKQQLIEKLKEAYRDEKYKWYFSGNYEDLDFLTNKILHEKDFVGCLVFNENNDIDGFISFDYHNLGGLKCCDGVSSIFFTENSLKYGCLIYNLFERLIFEYDLDYFSIIVPDKNPSIKSTLKMAENLMATISHYDNIENGVKFSYYLLEFNCRKIKLKLRK